MTNSAREVHPGLFIRGFAPPLRLADYRLVAFDMDSTLINIECIDEIAAVAGRRTEVAAITEAAMRGEITDRFGRLPAQGQTLFDTHRLRVLAKPYGVHKIDAGPKLMNILFRPQPPIDPMRIIELVQKNRAIKLAGNDKLRIDREIADPKERAQYIRDVLRSLGTPRALAS